MMMHEEQDSGAGGFALGDLVKMVWRRRSWLLAPLALGTLIAIIFAIAVRPVYQSKSTLLIESQQIPTSLVAAPFGSYAEERIARIRQQILSRDNLLKVVRDNKLYPGTGSDADTELLLARMREAIKVELVSAAAGSGDAHGAGANNTIAFNLSYRYLDPALTLKVTQQLTDMFVNEDKRLRLEQADGATAFLTRRADEIRNRLVEIENKRREIQARYNGALPDQVALSTQSTGAMRSEITRIDAEIQSILQQNSILASRSYEIEASTATPGADDVRAARQRVSQLSARLSDSHPDMVAAREALEAARQAAAAEPRSRAGQGVVNAEIAAGRSRMAQLSGQRSQIAAAIASAERMLTQSPQAAYELNNLERDHENLREQYAAIREKQLEAQVAANLQTENKGERFSVVDAPTLPLDPVGIGRVQIVLLGAIAGLALGLAAVLVWEMATGTIHGSGAIAALTGEAPLVLVPVYPGDDAPEPGAVQKFILSLRQRFAQ